MNLRLLFQTVQKVLLFFFCLAISFFAEGQSFTVRGRVTDLNGQPIAGATVLQKGTRNGTITDDHGQFTLTGSGHATSFYISSIGYEKQEVKADGSSRLTVILKRSSNELDQTVIRAYGTTTRRLNTGDISTVTAKEISGQPVANPLAALEGRVPGLVVSQTSGVPGAAFKVQIMGQNSLEQGSDPLIVVDGVPFTAGNTPLNNIANAAGSGGTSGISPLNTIDPANIESIEVLKDADATAIYGSRGANGVILITTRKGVAGKTKFDINVNTGGGMVTRTMKMLNTRQYVAMREEGFKNDNITPTPLNAPDITVWDTTRYTDLKKLLTGGTAHMTNAQATLSGGSVNTRFLIASSYHRETTVFPGDLADDRGSFHLNLNHNTADKRLGVNLNASYSAEKNDLTGQDLSYYINLPPNILLRDAAGNLNWQEGGIPFTASTPNPLASLYARYTGKFQNLTGDIQLRYQALRGLELKLNAGYNQVMGNESSRNPSESINPNTGTLPYASFGNSSNRGWILEPQAQYVANIGKGKLDILVGASFQSQIANSISATARNYTSDLLLGSINAAGDVTTNNSFSQYNYCAAFGRINYNWQDKYILNLSGRRDGSSRFGPGRRFANFGAVGAAWIFSGESFFRRRLPFISFGKLRISYGITGNDQIGNYQYLDSWSSSSTPYQDIPTLRTTKLFNPDYGWEVNRKLEAALDLGFFKDHLLLSLTWYRNRSGNQLINYPLPIQTGFPSVTENFNAIVQNSGLEATLTTQNIRSGSFTWSSSLLLTIPSNKLVSFPGLARSTYANTYIIGKPLSVEKTYKSLGVDAKTGIYQFKDVDGDGAFGSADRIALVNTDPRFYGGLRNDFQYKGLELTVFFQFKKQMGRNYLYTQSVYVPGFYYFNQPAIVQERWQHPGDKTNIGRYVASAGSPAFYPAAIYLAGSNAIYSDASYIRLKTVSISYSLPQGWTKRFSASSRVYLQAQNLLTITGYQGADPENQDVYVLPPLRVISGGIQITF
jgi:TonB-linked SusC/RagA family outer membrane protein